MKVTKKQTINLMDKFRINKDIIDPKWFRFGLNIEMEHKNIIGDNKDLLSMIVIAHLSEYPDYYQRLKKMEKAANKYWTKNKKPNIYI